MSDSIILPSLTNDMVLSVFRYLVDAELRKRMPGAVDFRFGCQEGIIAALCLMFGNADDLIVERSYDKNETWLQITERIAEEKLQSWGETLDELNDDPDLEIDYEQMVEAVNKAVNQFALENPTLMIDALKKNL
ncbi:MAG: hypothetical protein ACXAC5_03115 [Promethearchaeota archaeon]|jgi:hypothetical protein